MGGPLARSNFDMYLDNESEDNRRLIYIKQPCADEDARHTFFLHIIPARPRDLPANKQEYGFDNLDFNFNGDEIKLSDDWRVAIAPLPRYPIERIRTGQFTHAGHLWRSDMDLNE